MHKETEWMDEAALQRRADYIEYIEGKTGVLEGIENLTTTALVRLFIALAGVDEIE